MAIASLWDRWTDPVTGKIVTSFTMLTVNADQHPVMKQFHKPGDEKRSVVVLNNPLD
jgi:putative SOS response-associated peptidase YedK